MKAYTKHDGTPSVRAGVTLVGKELQSKPLPAGTSAGISKEAPTDGRQLVAYYFLRKDALERVGRELFGEPEEINEEGIA